MVTLNKARTVWARLGQVAADQRRTRLTLLPLFFKLYALDRYSPNEIFRHRLLGLSAAQRTNFISKERMLAIQRRLNPVDLEYQTEDKVQFHKHCTAGGLPVPELLAEMDLRDREQALAMLTSLADGEVVIKPADGYLGAGVYLLRCEGKHFRLPNGVELSADALLDSLRSEEDFSHWLIQERLSNHPDIAAISPSVALQTFRVVTFVDDDDVVHIIASQWRIAAPDAVKDNFNSGFSGNALCNIQVETGTIDSVFQFSARGIGMDRVTRHPVSGVVLTGLQVPYWDDVVTLARRGAAAMLPTRSIGWDIAVTAKGPFVIEANRYWDPQNLDGGMGNRLRFMAAHSAAIDYG